MLSHVSDWGNRNADNKNLTLIANLSLYIFI